MLRQGQAHGAASSEVLRLLLSTSLLAAACGLPILRPGVPRHDLDALFEPQNEGWLGGDSAASVAVGSDVLWIWADTLTGNLYRNATTGGIWRNVTGMPHNSLSRTSTDLSKPPTWNDPRKFSDGGGWLLPPHYNYTSSYYWPINAASGAPGQSALGSASASAPLFIACMAVSVGFCNITSTDIVVVQNPQEADPSHWKYASVTLPSPFAQGRQSTKTRSHVTARSTTLLRVGAGGPTPAALPVVLWTLGSAAGVDDDDRGKLYLLGSMNASVVLCRVDMQELATHADASGVNSDLQSLQSLPSLQYLTTLHGGSWQPRSAGLLPGDLRVLWRHSATEGSLHYNSAMRRWYWPGCQALDPGIYVAASPRDARLGDPQQGGWQVEKVYTIPDRLADGAPYFAYSAKAHPHYGPPSQKSLVLSFNTNSMNIDWTYNSTLAYHPRFIEVAIDDVLRWSGESVQMIRVLT